MKQKKSKAMNRPQIPLISGKDFPLCVRRQLVMAANQDSPHGGGFDDLLANGLLGSLSLDFSEKCRVIDAPLNGFQHDSLLEVWHEETEKFAELSRTQSQAIVQLLAKQVFVGFRLASFQGLSISSEVEDALACRMARRAGRRSAANMLDGLPDAYWSAQKLAAWFWRHLLPADHVAWRVVPPISAWKVSI